MLTKIISVIFIAVVGPVLVWFLVQRFSDKPVLKFNLSEPISTTVSENKNEYIQELFIKNVGRDEANKISIKIRSVGNKLEVKKNSSSDVYSIDKLEDNTEIRYDSLSPSGEIKILIRTSNGISKSQLQISHSKGLAVEAFSESSWVSLVASFILIIVIIGGLLYSIYGIYAFSQTYVNYGKEEYFLSRKKPFLITDKKWNNSNNEAKTRLFEKNATTRDEIKASFCYRFLNNKSSAIISDIEIDEFNNKCCDLIKKYFTESANRSYLLKELALLFTIEKPATMPDEKWEEIHKYLSTKYVSQYLGDLYLSGRINLSAEDIQCPDFILKTAWKRITDDITHVVTGNIISEIYDSNYVNSALRRDDLKISGLPSKNIQLIERAAFTLKIFRTPFQYTKNDAQKMLDEVTNDSLINESEKEPIKKICQYIVDIFEKESEITERESSVALKESEVNDLQFQFQNSRKKVLKQLGIIDSILNRDHAFLEKIEDYDMPFSPGNEANLRIVASLLQERKNG